MGCMHACRLVREAAADCLCELAKTVGASVLDIVRTSNLRPAQQQALISRLSSSSASSSLPAGMPAAGYHTSIGGYHMDDNTLDTVSVMDVEVVGDNGETATLRANSYMRPSTGPLKQQLQARPSGASSLGMLTTTGKAVSTGPAAMPPPAATTATTANAYVAPSAGPATAAKRKEAQAPAAGEGDLQAATPLPIYSEKELRMDLEKAIEELAKVIGQLKSPQSTTTMIQGIAPTLLAAVCRRVISWHKWPRGQAEEE